MRTIFGLFCCTLSAGCLWPQSPAVLGPAVLWVDRTSGSGKTALTFRNDTPAALRIALSASVPQQAGTGKTYDAQVLFAVAGASPKLNLGLAIPAGSTADVETNVSGIWDPGQFDVDLLNKGVKFGKLKVVSLPVSIKLDGAASDKLQLALVDGLPASIYLKNDDPAPYALTYRLLLADHEIARNDFTIVPNGSARLAFTPSVPGEPYNLQWVTPKWYFARLQELLKPAQRDGELLLYVRPPGQTADLGSPIKRFPLKASFDYFPDTARQVLSYLIVVIILTLGGVSSLALSFFLPHRLQKLNIKERLEALAATIANLGGEVDSRLGVAMRVERSRLYELLKSRSTISPEFVGIIDQCNQGVAKLTTRVGLMQQMDLVIAQLSVLAGCGVTPSKADRIRANLEAAMVVVGKREPTDADLQAAQTAISDAAREVGAMNQPDAAFLQELAQRVHSLVIDIQANHAASPTFRGVVAQVPGPWGELRTINPAANTVDAGRAKDLDMAVAQVELIRLYVRLVDGTNDSAMRERLAAHQAQLLGYLQLKAWDALLSARLLVREMEGDIYAVRLQQALAPVPPEASIRMEPTFAYESQPLRFRIQFHSRPLDAAAAREEWTCAWDFGDGLTESGWTVSHYFLLCKRRQSRKITVRATFRDEHGHQVQNSAGAPVEVTREITIHPSSLNQLLGERTFTEALRLAAALLIAIFALVSGAKDQLTKLDVLPGLVAVFLVGFGADTIKNLLTNK